MPSTNTNTTTPPSSSNRSPPTNTDQTQTSQNQNQTTSQSLQPSSQLQPSQQIQQDLFLTNDYYPLQQANKAIISALRADEVSSNGDLYKKIASSTSSSSSTYDVIRGNSTGASHTGANHNVNGNVNGNGHSGVENGDHDMMNGNGSGFRMHDANMDANATPTNGTGHSNKSQSQSQSKANIHPTLKYTNSIPLPPYITQIIQTETKISSLMGILPLGNMVWVSVDDALYLWEYGRLDGNGEGGRSGNGSHRDDFVCFRVPSGQCVVSVGLVKPKKGVFKEVVEWCLVVTTYEEAIICALTRESMVQQQQSQQPFNSSSNNYMNGHGNTNSNSSDTHLKLIPTRYLIPTDSMPMLSICGTDDGRIFMGGYDGCLYEMSYEGFVPSTSSSSSSSSTRRGGWYEEDDQENHNHDNETYSVVNTLTTGSKRALSTLLFGPSGPGGGRGNDARPRKCRKVNHTSLAPRMVSAFVPGFVLNAASFVFGSNSTTAGGPIVKLTLDNDRKTMYALTSLGFIHAFDLDTVSGNGSSGGVSGSTMQNNHNNSPPKLACSINVSKSIRKYLDCVAHGKMYVSPMTGTDGSIAAIHFAGGGAAAQAGVGGMEGARSILRIAASEMMRNKQTRQASAGRNSNVNERGTNVNANSARRVAVTNGCLHPISIHVIPPSESKFLTLVAISTAGLRYYLSVLPDTGTSRYGNNLVKPGRRFSLCHIRAPPPLSITSNDDLVIDGRNVNISSSSMNSDGRDTGISPGINGRNGSLNFEAKNACYTSGVTLLAINSDNSTLTGGGNNSQKAVGDSILVMTPDYTSQDERDSSYNTGPLSSYMDTTAPMGGMGLSEVVSQPMRNKGSTKLGATIMAGGHIWDITVRKAHLVDHVSPSILSLYLKSSTPSDSILESAIVSPFIPASMFARRSKTSETRQTHDKTSFDAAKSATERQAVRADLGFFNGGLASLALNIFGSMLFNKPTTSIRVQGKVPTYRVVDQSGCSTQGFSSSALEKSKYGRKSTKSSRGAQSQRLQPALLNPSTTPLPEMSLQHLVMKSRRQGLIALNSGGLHYFSQLSPIDKLQTILMESHSNNIGRDENVKSFFSNYGRVECSALCLSIAIDDEANDKIARSAVQAALRFANRPRLISTPSGNGGNSMVTDAPSWNNIPGYQGYTFQPSSLHDGVMALVSRLLRPIWCKPAVVVTEGKVIQPKRRGQRPRIIPAKVELLLDETTLDRIRRPLARLQFLMKEVFQPAVSVVPGGKPHHGDNSMDTDESDNYLTGRSTLMTSAVQYQTQASSQNQNFRPTQHTEKELNATARLYEERSIHATYRIVSRSVQLLTLLSHLRRAHDNPELPEVDFGYLHGLTYSQLVISNAAQDRIDTVLTNLFTDNSSFVSHPNTNEVSSSVESNNLSSLLSSQCYLYFSIGSRLTHLGFSKAQAAMYQQPSTKKRVEFTNSASSYLRQAASLWHNPLLISGQMGRTSPKENTVSYEEMAIVAHESGSPLARAAFVLMELGDVVSVVEICLICASNFGGVIVENVSGQYNTDRVSGAMMPWEKGLYHRPTSAKADDETNSQLFHSASSTAIIIANSDTDTRKTDAQRTCHAVLFYYLNSLLKSAYEHHQNIELAEKMLSVATASTDINFLKELYGYLASSGHVETLLKIDSPSVESWLENINRDPDLVWRYYVMHGMHWLAGEFMWKRGSAPDENLRIEERIQCLNRASNSYSDALINSSQNSMIERNTVAPNRDETQRIINQIREQIDVAELQSRVLSAIMSSQNASQLDKEKLRILSSSLINVSTLYNEYAAPLALYDLCLAIMQTCRCDEEATIITLWRSILCEELLPCRTGSKEVQLFMNSLQRGSMMEEESIILSDASVTHTDGDSLMLFEDGEWIPSIKHRVIALGKEFHGKGADFVFPIEFITEQLEGLYCIHKSVSKKSAAPWTLQTLIEAGTSFPSLLEAYNSIVVSQEPDAPNPITKLTQLSCISKVMKQWLSSASAFGDKGDSSSMQLQNYTPTLLHQIDSYKSTLESIVGWNSQDVSNLCTIFSEIEESLRRNDN